MKKEPKENFQQKRPSFLVIGLMASLSLTLVAFEWTGFNYKSNEYVDSSIAEDWTEPIPVTIIKNEPEVKPKNRKARSPEVKIVDKLTKPKGKVDFSLKAAMSGFDSGGDEDYGEPADGDEGTPTIIYDLLGNKPHYADCENIVDPDAQAACTESKIIQFVVDNTKFPSELRNLEQTIYVNFVIDTDGSITEVEASGRKTHPRLEKAAVDAVSKLPAMVPGEQLGKPVRVRFTIPVRFKPIR